ncbi:hypothetical protein GTR04_5132 [Trichophyton interdigitale]|uniref:Uncharacterized protein n=1 Tax=Trichophyton interdigitale TaxID=101480 RepID=A0A9P4YEV0_9EURO|nr:hypothetical protein GY632_4797 [Trichophyton interdigitale]KAF3892170.1 hypothetical protein GY631_4373 [Trichophyton interdigitale]KAG8207490.1 hypothetical protein GTR04_5132 [Trichophyton interdigitale]
MGNKISAVSGVKSPKFYEPGNAVNEIWVGNLEIISRLPFGDSDMAQAGWPKNDYPKFPWRPFVIPLFAMFTNGAAGAETAAGTAAPSHLARRSTPQEPMTKTAAAPEMSMLSSSIVSAIITVYAVVTILLACAPKICDFLDTVYFKCRRSARDLLEMSAKCLHQLCLLGIYSKPYLICSYLFHTGVFSPPKKHTINMFFAPAEALAYLVVIQLLSTIFAAVTCYGNIYRYCRESRPKQADEMALWQETSLEIEDGSLEDGMEKSRPEVFGPWVFTVNLCAFFEAITTMLLLINLSRID